MTSNLKSAANAPAVTEPCRWIIAVGQTQDRQSFERLFLRFAPKLKSYFLRYGWEDALAEDMAQDVLLAVWRKAIQFDSTRATARGWIYAIARNLRIDRERRARRILPPLDGWPRDEPDPETQCCATQTETRLKSALGDLPREQSAVIHLAYFEDRSHVEIAQQLHLPLGTVKSRIRRAAERLRSKFDG
jgi:RNA polymerase sigma-70 factor (ECF subfamily)